MIWKLIESVWKLWSSFGYMKVRFQKNTTLPIDVKVVMKLQNMLCSHATPHAYIYVCMLCHMNDRSFTLCWNNVYMTQPPDWIYVYMHMNNHIIFYTFDAPTLSYVSITTFRSLAGAFLIPSRHLLVTFSSLFGSLFGSPFGHFRSLVVHLSVLSKVLYRDP